MNYIIKNNINILVIGDVMLDHYIYGNCNRISPEAPVQVVDVKKETYTLGGAGNVIKNLRSFNCSAALVAVVGFDDTAEIVIEQLTNAGANNNGIIKDEQRCTTVKSRVMVSNHQLIRLDREDTQTINDVIAQKLIAIIEPDIAKYDMVLLSDYNKGLLSPVFLNRVFEMCKTTGIKTLVDPKGIDFSKYKGANIIKPNKKEAIIATGINIINQETLKQACAKIKEITGCDDVIVTMSEDGIAMFDNDELTVIPTKALEVVDVTGAGDTVLASLGLAIASGNNLWNACDFANHAAAVVVNKVGSATATLEEVKNKFIN
jgi:rfaE bifunctional protein kinase chain/domain